MLGSDRCWHMVVFLLVTVLDIADLVSNWLFYVDVRIAEEGLVYGLPDQGAVIGLLVFSIFGTFSFTFEILNLARELWGRSGKPWVNVDLVAAVIMWLEDIPQISINVFIATCREDPISIFQITKAAVVITSIIVRIIMAFVRYCSEDSLHELGEKTTASRLHVAYRVLIVLGLLLNFAGAVVIFVFTQTQRDLNGKVIFQAPDTIFEDRYNDDRYFKNVSIYFHHPTFDVQEAPTNVTEANWMRLITINSVRNLPDKVVLFSYEYQNTTTELKMILWENDDGLLWEPVECYTLVKSNLTLIKGSNCRTYLAAASKRTTIIFKFSFTPPDRVFRRLVFGDIKFNAKYNDNNGFCEDISADNITDNIEAGLEKSIDITVHYYRTHMTEENHVIISDGTGPRFYRQEDLTDITKVWATGWGQCDPKGSLAPHIDRNIDTPCSVMRL